MASLTPPERVPFTSGRPPPVHAWNRHARSYAMALLFLAFDMEMVFMYPWAVARGEATPARNGPDRSPERLFISPSA